MMRMNENGKRQLFEAIMLNEDWQSTLADYKKQDARAKRQYDYVTSKFPDYDDYKGNEVYKDDDFVVTTSIGKSNNIFLNTFIVKLKSVKYDEEDSIKLDRMESDENTLRTIKNATGAFFKRVIFRIGSDNIKYRYSHAYYDEPNYENPHFDNIIQDIEHYCQLIKDVDNSKIVQAIFQEWKPNADQTKTVKNKKSNAYDAFKNRMDKKVDPIWRKARDEYEDNYKVSIGELITLDGKKDPWEVIDIQGDQVKLKSPGGATKYVPVSYAEERGRHLLPKGLRSPNMPWDRD